MAALTTNAGFIAAGGVISDVWYDPSSGYKHLNVTIPASQGGATNTIAAACFGLTTVEGADNARISSSDKAFLAGPSFDKTKLYLYTLVDATDATRNSPADTSAATKCHVYGKE
jgi:hypothetical protein